MKSKVTGKKYEILANDKERFAIKVDKKVTDNCLTKLSKAMETVINTMERKRWTENNDLYYFLKKIFFRKPVLRLMKMDGLSHFVMQMKK